MANPAISYDHPLATAQLAAGSETEDGPIQNIATLAVATKWRSMAVPAFFTADLGTEKTIRYLALFGTSLSDAATLRLLLSTTDAHAGDVYDSGTIAADAAEILDGRRQCLHVLPAAESARYAKVELDDPAADFVDVGYAALNDWFQPAYARSWGAGDGVADPSLKQRTLAGNIIVTKRAKWCETAFSLDSLLDSEKSAIRALDRVAGASGPVVFIPNPAASDAAAEMLLGMLKQTEPLVRRQVNIRSRAFAIEELL